MAIRISNYIEPGVFIENQPVQPIPGFIGLPRQVVLIGEGNRCKRVVDESHLRGYVDLESVSPNAVGSPEPTAQDGDFTLARHSDGITTTMFLFKNGEQQADDSFSVTYPVLASALVTGAPVAGGALDGTATYSYKVTFVVNGLETKAGTVSNTGTTTGTDKTFNLTSIPKGPVGTTARNIYRTEGGNAVTGPWLFLATLANNTATIYTDTIADTSLTTTIPTVSGVTLVNIVPGIFDSGASYTFSYQSLTFFHHRDALIFDITDAHCNAIERVGSFPGIKSFVDGQDYTVQHTGTNTISSTGLAVTGSGTLFTTEFSAGDLLVANGQVREIASISTATSLTLVTGFSPNVTAGTSFKYVDGEIEWFVADAATLTGSVTGPFDFTVSGGLPKTLKVTIDNGSEQTVTFVTGDFALPAAATATEVATKINTVVGFTFATVSSNKIVLTSVTTGPSSVVEIGNGTANTVLGFTNFQIDVGQGKNPAQGEEYFVTYSANRPDSEYNTPILSTSFDQLIAKIGPLAADNALALAGQIAFEQNPPFLWHIQVENTGTGAAAQDIDYKDAIDGAEINPELTDLIVLGHPTVNAGGKKQTVRAHLRQHVVDMSSLQNRGERIGWFGMAVGTDVGDTETAGTFVYVATRELQVSANSPGRGRFVLTGPSFIKKTFRLNNEVRQLTLDSTYTAAGCAALNASFLSPAEGLLRKELSGLDDVEDISRGDRDFLASRGVNLLVDRNGVLVFFDPVATDLTSAEFREINVMNQKDNIARRVRKQLDDTLIGVVPDDLAQFVFDVKSQIAVQLVSSIADGAIAPYQNADGSTRNIDLVNDIIVTQRRSDPTSYDFRFFFFVKFIAKRLFGTYSVVIPSGT